MYRFTRQTLPAANRKYFFMNILCIEFFCPQKTHNRKLFFGDTLLKRGRHFDYRKQPLNMRMRVCYMDCHDATHKKSTAPITAVRLPFVAYLLTSPRVRFFAVFPSASSLIPRLSLELHRDRLLQNLHLFTVRQVKGNSSSYYLRCGGSGSCATLSSNCYTALDSGMIGE
jgi:hypothetical protein